MKKIVILLLLIVNILAVSPAYSKVKMSQDGTLEEKFKRKKKGDDGFKYTVVYFRNKDGKYVAEARMRNGKVIIPTSRGYDDINYDEISRYRHNKILKGQGYFKVLKNGKKGICDASGKEIVEPIYDIILYWSLGEDHNKNGYFLIIKDGKTGILDAYGEVLIEPILPRTSSSFFDVIWIGDDRHVTIYKKPIDIYIDREGHGHGSLANEIDIEMEEKDGYKWTKTIQIKNGKFLIGAKCPNQKTGEFLPAQEVEDCRYIGLANDKRLFEIKKDGKAGCYDNHGKEIIPIKYDGIELKKGKHRRIGKEYTWIEVYDIMDRRRHSGVFDIKGNQVVNLQYELSPYQYSDLVIIAKRGAKHHIYSKNGGSYYSYECMDRTYTAFALRNRELVEIDYDTHLNIEGWYHTGLYLDDRDDLKYSRELVCHEDNPEYKRRKESSTSSSSSSSSNSVTEYVPIINPLTGEVTMQPVWQPTIPPYNPNDVYVPQNMGTAPVYNSGSSGGSQYNSGGNTTNTNNNTQKRKCNYCNGTGRKVVHNSVATYGTADYKVHCNECGGDFMRSSGHAHVYCNECKGTGYW